MSRRVLRGFAPDRLVSARAETRLSRGEVARLVDVTTGAVGAWERGAATPQIESLARVAALLGVRLDELVVIPESERYLGDLRTLRGITQPTLAKALGIATSTLADLERGQSRLSEAMAAKLSAALGVDTAVVAAAYERVRTRPAHIAP